MEDAGANPLLGGSQRAPEDAANLLSRYTFWWVFPSIRAANQKARLLQEDLPKLPRVDDPETLFFRVAELWRTRRNDSARILRYVCWGIQRRVFLYSVLHGWTFLLFMTIDPLMLRVLLNAVQDRGSVSFVVQIGLVAALSCSMLLRVTCMEICFFASVRVQNNVRSVLVHAIFRKALCIPDHELDAGRISNLMATDADKIGKWSSLLFSLSQWSWTFFSLPFLVYFLYQLVGSAAFVGTAMVVLGAGTARALGHCLQSWTKVVQECRDCRASLMSEMVRGIRTVKLQVWEPVWHARISAARNEEMKAIVRVRVLQAFSALVGSVLSVMVPVSIFAWYTLVIGERLDAATAFTTLAWISTLQWSVQALPGIYRAVANLKPSFDRIDRFLTTPVTNSMPISEGSRLVELEETQASQARSVRSEHLWHQEAWLRTRSGRSGLQCLAPGPESSSAIKVCNAAFGYKRLDDLGMLEETCVLDQMSFEIQQASFVMIAGPVGSGKSTLLASLACSRPPLRGLCRVFGQRAYVPQRPFLLNGTLKENILFGLPVDDERYSSALHMTALLEDLKTLLKGDSTQVGESGVQLSGGQKARVALARAVYANADVVCLDDVLSAVDAHTARYIWDTCFIDGLLRNKKTVILVSHQIQYLSRPEVDAVILLQKGRLWLHGPWSELANSGDAFLSLVQEWDEEESALSRQSSASSISTPERNPDELISLPECQSAISSVLGALEGRRIDANLIRNVQETLGGTTEQADLIREGSISWPDFRLYLHAFGSKVVVSFMLLIMVFSAASQIWSTLYLAAWTSSTESETQQAQNVLTYFLISISTALANCLQAILLTACALCASRSIHQDMLRKVLGAPMAFFDISPTGRILNRFLQDLQNIDNFLPDSISDQIMKTLTIVTQLSLVYIEAPWVLCSLPILAVPYSLIYNRMRVPNRDSRRLESAARSPVYTHFGDALHGRETVRAFAAEERFEKENLKHVGTMAAGLYGNQAVGKWAQALTTQWGCVLYCISAFVCVELSRKGLMQAGHMGLVLLYSAQLQRGMMDYMMGAADVETKFVSVERVAEYLRLEPEEAEEADEHSEHRRHRRHCGTSVLSTVWRASEGEVHLENVAMRYRLHRALVLKGISLNVKGKSKLAFCGRTGCGKSSLFSVLNRLYPLASGRVLVDKKDVSQLSLQALRTNIRVVSQEAFLLSGSLRQNLSMGAGVDHGDDVLWHCLSVVGLEEKVRSLPGNLDLKVDTAGQNFSVGERQLITLARVLVPNFPCCSLADWEPPRILLCDEATANIDVLTDEKVHQVVLGMDATVMMICHRLQHITRFQQVVVLDEGLVAEQGSPEELLDSSRQPLSHLATLCAAAGL